MEEILKSSFEKWYSFYRLINNKLSFVEADTIIATIRLKSALEDFKRDREILINFLEDKNIDYSRIIKSEDTYISNYKIYIDENIVLERQNISNNEFNDYILNQIHKVVKENIDIYFDYADNILSDDERENIDIATSLFDDKKELIEKVFKLLYLFKNSERSSSKQKDLEEFLRFSVNKNGLLYTKEDLYEVLDTLKKSEIIHLDWMGNYSIISEEKKRLSNLMSSLYKEIDAEQRSNYIFDLIKEKIIRMIEYIGVEKIKVDVDIEGNKIFRSENSELLLKIDSYSRDNRDIRRGYYVLKSQKHKNLLFWYGKRILDLDERVRHIIAYGQALERLEQEWKKDKEKMKFMLEQKFQYTRLLDDINYDIEMGFRNGGYIFDGEDKKINGLDSIVEVFEYLVQSLEGILEENYKE
ncbi:MAG: hypothetical protein ACRDDL_06095 [Sarcina sp.]